MKLSEVKFLIIASIIMIFINIIKPCSIAMKHSEVEFLIILIIITIIIAIITATINIWGSSIKYVRSERGGVVQLKPY